MCCFKEANNEANKMSNGIYEKYSNTLISFIKKVKVSNKLANRIQI